MNKKITVEQTAKLLSSVDNIIILSHASPDGDTVGSAYALRRALISMGKRVRYFVNDSVSSYFDFMRQGLTDEDFKADFVITVDVAAKRLLGEPPYEKYDEFRRYFDNVDLNIDHHYLSNGLYAEYNLVEDTAAAAEIVYWVIKAMNVEITKEIAAAVYTGIATDTGLFKFSNVTPQTHRLAAELMETGFDFKTINYNFFEKKTKRRLSLEQYILGSISFYFDGRCAVSAIPFEEYSKYDIEDINGVSAIPREIEGVDVGVLLKEKYAGEWRVSFRTSSNADAELLAKHFGGGGHKRAAGCSIKGDIKYVIEAVINCIQKYVELS